MRRSRPSVVAVAMVRTSPTQVTVGLLVDGVAVANGANIAEARERAKLAASKVRPRKG